MRAFSLAVSLLASSAAVAFAQDANSVLTALNKLSTDLKTLQSDLNQVSDGIFNIANQLQASVDTIAVDNDILATTAAVTAAAKFSASDSQTIINAVNNLVTVSNTTITTTIQKQPAFAGLSPVVLASLYALKIDTGNLGFAFAFKLDQSVLNQGVTDLTALNNQFQSAINVYASASY